MDNDRSPITEYWAEHYIKDNHCGLCGNCGVIDTTGTTTAAAYEVGGRYFCICPNGQAMREGKANIERVLVYKLT